MRKENSIFHTKFISEPGSYLRNSDYFAFVELENAACYCIADGIDTDSKRESARIAVTAVITEFTENPGFSKKKANYYMQIAHQALLRETREARLEVSMVILLTDYKKAVWASAGNTRLFFMRNGNIKSRTKDTSLSQNMIDRDELALDQLSSHEERHNLYCYLGQPGHFKPIISAKKKLEDGDILVAYTRGVWECVGDAELLDAVDGVSNAEDVCTGLEDVILSQQLEIVENYTIVTIFVDKVYRNPKAGKIKKYTKIIVSVAVVLLGLVGAFVFARYRTNKSNQDKMLKHENRGIEYLTDVNYEKADEEFAQAVELADEIKVNKKSDIYEDVQAVETYKRLSGYLVEGDSGITESEYKIAADKYQSALDSVAVLSSEYGQNTDYAETIEDKKAFALAMLAGDEAYEAEKYSEALASYENAVNLGENINDTAVKKIAEEKQKTAKGKEALSQGAAYEEMAQAEVEQGLYTQALDDYEAAKSCYQLAKDEYGNTEAESKMALVDIKIENINATMDKQSAQQMEQEAATYVEQAAEALHNGNNEQAAQLYEKAKSLYQKTGNVSMVVNLSDKLENAKYGTEKEDEADALEYVLEATELLAEEKYTKAISKLEKARGIYKDLDRATEASQIQGIINQINTVIEKKKNEQEKQKEEKKETEKNKTEKSEKEKK